MVSGPEEDEVPTAAGVAVDDTAAEARPPAASVTVTESSVDPPVEEDEHTVRQALDPEIAKLVRSAPRPAVPLLVKPPPSASMKAATPPPPRIAASPPTVASPGAPPPPAVAPAGPPPPMVVMAKTLASTGVAPPPPVSLVPKTTASAGAIVSPVATSVKNPEPEELDDEELEEVEPLDDSITATAPRLDKAKLPISIPGSVAIKTVVHDDIYDETEVKTMAGPLDPPRRIGASASQTDPHEHDDGPTTQAIAPAAGRPFEPVTSTGAPSTDRDNGPIPSPLTPPTPSPVVTPKMRASQPSNPDPPTSPGITTEAPTRPGVATSDVDQYDPDAEESITTRGLALQENVDEESVTKLQPPVSADGRRIKVNPAAGTPAVGTGAIGAEVELEEPEDPTGTTQQKKLVAAVSPDDESPADEESESITTQAPGHLTNMLRVIASGTDPDGVNAIEDEDDDDQPDNKTAVMIGAPVKMPGADSGSIKKHGTIQGFPPAPVPMGDAHPSARMPASSGGRAAALAPRLEPESDSGLRVARGSGSGERESALASVDPLDALRPLLPSDAQPTAPGSGSNETGRHKARIGLAATEPAFPILQPPPPVEEGAFSGMPRYGLLVGVVAAISILVPIVLFIVLRGPNEEPPAVVPAQPSADLVRRADPLRGKKGDRTQPSPSTSAFHR